MGKVHAVFGDFIDMKGPQAKVIQALIECLATNIPILIVTDDTPKLIKLINLLSIV